MKIQRKQRSLVNLILLFVVYTLYFGISTLSVHVLQPNIEKNQDIEKESHNGRHLLEFTNETCTPRSIDEFPGDFFSPEERKNGGIFIHFLLSIYIFGALSIICDDYFVPALEKISDVLKLQPDVAGATFMAAGSSAPELFTSVIGVFLAKSDVGIGTIVGSAVFNILFIIAIVGLLGGGVIYLTWWPLIRDCLYYLLSVVVLTLVIYDEQVHWYEAAGMLALYVIYIIIMYFNPKLSCWAMKKMDDYKAKRNIKTSHASEPIVPSSEGDDEKKPLLNGQNKMYDDDLEKHAEEKEIPADDENEEGPEEYESPLTIPDTFGKRVFWLIMLPFNCLFVLTVPDCRRPGCWQKTWALTFFMSIVWIAGLSYIMVWMVTIIGDTLGIPDTVMGLSFLAAGTSVPDALASLYVARDGFGDMAVSNSIGSNVFDILLCLGLPWLLQTGFISLDSVVTINSAGLTFSAITLLGTVFFLLLAVILNGWKLDKKLGVICLFVYAIFLVISVLTEMNVFGVINPPPCPRVTTW